MEFNWYDYLKKTSNGFFVEFPIPKFNAIHKETGELPSILNIGDTFSINDHTWKCIDLDDNYIYLNGIK